MTTRYRQLQPEERVTLAALRLQNRSLRQIAVVLGRSPGTLSRELKRNSQAGTNDYSLWRKKGGTLSNPKCNTRHPRINFQSGLLSTALVESFLVWRGANLVLPTAT